MDAKCSELDWSVNPGAYEAHLFRRCGSPYFPASQRVVSREELAEAKRIDNNDYTLAKKLLEKLLEEIGPKLASGIMKVSEANDIRQDFDDLVLFSLGVGGQAYDIAAKAELIRQSVISDIESTFAHDKEAMAIIEDAKAFDKSRVEQFYIPVVAADVWERSPVPKEDSIATILSEDPETIAVVMKILPKANKAQFRLEALKMMKEALRADTSIRSGRKSLLLWKGTINEALRYAMQLML